MTEKKKDATQKISYEDGWKIFLERALYAVNNNQTDEILKLLSIKDIPSDILI